MQDPGILKVGHTEKFPYLLAAVTLALPFAIILLYTKGLTQGLDMMFFYDEAEYHYPVILQFAKQLPFPDLSNYNSATTPLFHLLFAALSKIFGADIQHLRMFNFIITILSVLLLFKLLTKQFNLPYSSAFISTLLFALSPYFFREAFVVMTDNLPVLWLLLFFQHYLKFRDNGSFKNYLFSLFFIMLLSLTRQTYMYILFPVAADLLINKNLKQSQWLYYLFLIAAVIPTFSLFIIWKGLTPPQFQERHTEETLLNIKPILYGVAVVGFYSLFIAGDKIYRTFLTLNKLKVITAILLSWALLFLFPLTKAKHDFGYLWFIADELPSLHGTPVFFYILVSVGVCAFMSTWQIEKRPFFLLFFIGLFLSEVPNKYFFQRYYDSSILILLLFLDAKYDQPDRFQIIRKALLTIFFIFYFIVFIIK